MIVIVGGGRDYERWDRVVWSLDYWRRRLKISLLVHGAQTTVHPEDVRKPVAEQRRWGAGYFARRWAMDRGVPNIEERTSDDEWRKLGVSAAPALNTRMLIKHRPERVIVFPEDEDLLAQARRLRVKCIEVASP